MMMIQQTDVDGDDEDVLVVLESVDSSFQSVAAADLDRILQWDRTEASCGVDVYSERLPHDRHQSDKVPCSVRRFRRIRIRDHGTCCCCPFEGKKNLLCGRSGDDILVLENDGLSVSAVSSSSGSSYSTTSTTKRLRMDLPIVRTRAARSTGSR